MTTTTTLITADELLHRPDDGYRYELVKGELKRRPPTGGEHGVVSMRFGSRLEQYVEKNNLGITFAAETGFRIAADPDTVRALDAAFVHRDRIPEGGPPILAWRP